MYRTFIYLEVLDGLPGSVHVLGQLDTESNIVVELLHYGTTLEMGESYGIIFLYTQ